MRRIREVLRLRYECGLNQRLISASEGISKGSVSDYLARATAAGMTWADASSLDEDEVERRLFAQIGHNEPPARVPIDYEWVHREMRRPGVTLQLLWVEYRDAAATAGHGGRAYQYSQFCDLYADFRAKVEVSMRQVHRAGEKAFLDYSGKKPAIVDPATGEVIEVELFVMVLGASNYTYAEATRTQQTADFVGSTVRGLEYFGGVPQILVPDQLRSAVTGPDRYDPEINATYAEMARHYGVAIVPARPRKPKDKAKVEAGVLLAQRWILACLRLAAFFKELGSERCAKLEAVTLDMSAAYLKAVTEATPEARVIFDRFHVQRLAHDALDEVRREQVRAAAPEDKRELKHTRFALQKNPWNLSALEEQKVADVQRTNLPLYRAYLLKETLAGILDGRQVHVARAKLLEWIGWAARARLRPFQKLARTVRAHLEGILAYVATGLSNARTEGLNGKIRTITRRSFGFHGPTSLIALIFLCCSGITLLPVHR